MLEKVNVLPPVVAFRVDCSIAKTEGADFAHLGVFPGAVVNHPRRVGRRGPERPLDFDDRRFLGHAVASDVHQS
jgi:hypothetical protein